MCANDACGGSLSSCFQSSQSLSSPSLLLASRASFVASSLAALHALHPQNALLVAAPDSTTAFRINSFPLCVKRPPPRLCSRHRDPVRRAPRARQPPHVPRCCCCCWLGTPLLWRLVSPAFLPARHSAGNAAPPRRGSWAIGQSTCHWTRQRLRWRPAQQRLLRRRQRTSPRAASVARRVTASARRPPAQ